MSGRKSAVPWLDWREWQDVHEGLFSSDPYAQQRFASRVAAWRSRAQLPVAINATAQLVELQLHEQISQHHHHAVGVSSRSHMELSLLYASAIVRCVNGLVDGSQKGAYAMAVSQLAQRIGIPLWVVDLRHESTHNQLPSLPVLRFAAQHLLAWLRANYWGAQEDAIRGQVHHVGRWLFEQLPHLSRGEEEMQREGGSNDAVSRVPPLVLDAESLRNVVVPLLVDGGQYRESVAPAGLLFLEVPKVVENSNDAEIPQRDAFIALLLQLQSNWSGFSAALLAGLCRKVFGIILPTKAQNSEDDSEEPQSEDSTEEDRLHGELELALLWIKFLISGEWREKLKFEKGPVEDLYQCGAEVLALTEQQMESISEDRIELLGRLQTALRFSKGVRQHSLLGTEAAISTSLADGKDQGWIQLPGWTPSTIGVRHCFMSCNQAQVYEYSLDDDSLMPNSTTFVVPREEEDSTDGSSFDAAETAMDALMEDLDASFDTSLQQTLELQTSIARDGLRQGDSTTVLPKQELQRIQEEIEIW